MINLDEIVSYNATVKTTNEAGVETPVAYISAGINKEKYNVNFNVNTINLTDKDKALVKKELLEFIDAFKTKIETQLT